MGVLQIHGVLAVGILHQLSVVEVHLGHTDKARHEEIGRVVEELLGGADLLDEAVLHDDDAVAQGHGLGLVVGNVDEGGIDAGAELDELGAHLVAQLGVQVGQRLVHQQYLRLPDDGTADGHTLALAAGEGLGLAVQVLGDAQDLRRLIHPGLDLILGVLPQLQGELHVLPDGHVGVQGVVLEHHGDVTILGGHVVHELAVDVQLAAADLLQSGDHPQRGGLAAAGGANQHDELLVLDLQVEVLHRQNALVGDLEIGLLLLLALLLFLGLTVGIDFLDVFQDHFCHSIEAPGPVHPHAGPSRPAALGRAALRQVSTLPHREPGGYFSSFF